MNHCPITYEPISTGQYSPTGLRLLSVNLQQLHDFDYDAKQQVREAVIRAGKMSIQGVQPKLSVRLNAKAGTFEVVDRGGRFIVKPQQEIYPNLPENEGLTMQLARQSGIDVPLTGLLRCRDGSWSYFIRRFDRAGQKDKVPVEDFAQLSGQSRHTKYDFSMERLVDVIDAYCTFPKLDKLQLFKRSLFNFIVGNEDMHLKNFSLITRTGKIELAPAYDFLSTTVTLQSLGEQREKIEEVALPLQGKKRNLKRQTWVDYFGRDRLGLSGKSINAVLEDLKATSRAADEFIARSFLPSEQKILYQSLVRDRSALLQL